MNIITSAPVIDIYTHENLKNYPIFSSLKEDYINLKESSLIESHAKVL